MTIDDRGAIDLLRTMLAVPSLSGEEDAVADVILQSMRAMGLVAFRDAVGNVVGTRPHPTRDSGPSVTLLGHMDTVPGWVPVDERDGKLYGRGAVDAKGPLAASIVAAARVQGFTRVTVVGAVQEEASSTGARHIAAQQPPDFLVIGEPSGVDAIVLGYKGSQRFTVEWSQPCAHAAGKEPTAPERSVMFWDHLTAWCRLRGSSTGNAFRQLTPRLLGMASSSDGLYETSCLSVGLRLPPDTTLEDVRVGVQQLWPDAHFTFTPGEQPVLADKGTPLVAAFLRSMRSQGIKPRFKVKTGTSDMNVVGPAWGSPMLAYGPGDSNLDHTPDEHVQIDEYLSAIRVLTAALEDL